jgi:uncharacterized protein (TIGR00255 family)
MTGYGRVREENDRREITVELRSVNHRYLDLTIKVPRLCGYLEDMVKQRVSAALARGKVDVFITVRQKDGDARVLPNAAVIRGYVEAARAVSAEYGLPDELTALSLLRMPDALDVDRDEPDAEQLTAEVAAVLDKALAEHDAMRSREGARLCEDVAQRAALIGEMIDFIEKRSPDSVEEYRARIAQRMTEILDGSELSQQRILQEAALFADKVSVTEELVRLRSHLHQLDQMMRSKTAVGRKLDFLVQEMNREANTIGSKANDYEIAHTVVELKAEIEKIREQIQNLE